MTRGWEYVHSRKPEEACDLFAQAVAEARFLHNPLVLVEALMALGQVECSLKHPASAVDSYREAADVAGNNGEAERQAEALIEIAALLEAQKRTEEGSTICDQLLALQQKQENDAALPRARALHMLARFQEHDTEHDELALLLQAAASLYETAGDHSHAAECQSQLAFLLGQ